MGTAPEALTSAHVAPVGKCLDTSSAESHTCQPSAQRSATLQPAPDGLPPSSPAPRPHAVARDASVRTPGTSRADPADVGALARHPTLEPARRPALRHEIEDRPIRAPAAPPPGERLARPGAIWDSRRLGYPPYRPRAVPAQIARAPSIHEGPTARPIAGSRRGARDRQPPDRGARTRSAGSRSAARPTLAGGARRQPAASSPVEARFSCSSRPVRPYRRLLAGAPCPRATQRPRPARTALRTTRRRRLCIGSCASTSRRSWLGGPRRASRCPASWWTSCAST